MPGVGRGTKGSKMCKECYGKRKRVNNALSYKVSKSEKQLRKFFKWKYGFIKPFNISVLFKKIDYVSLTKIE